MDASLDRLWFLGEPVAVQRRVIKAIGDEAGIPLEYKHVEEVLNFAVEDGPGGKQLSLPLGWKLRREAHEILFVTPDLRERPEADDYEYELPRAKPLCIPELGSTIELKSVVVGMEGYNPDQLLDADSLPGLLKVRNWRAGDRFWPSHTKSPKKIKELLQERHVPQSQRKVWPVVVGGDEIVWVKGFAVPSRFRAKPGGNALVILETATPIEEERLP